MFAIANGRKALWQWDLNQQLTVAGSCTEVHFLDKGSLTTLTVEVKDKKADIPNILLQKAGRLVVYAYIIDEQDHHTKVCETFGIAPRPKPAEYVYTETEVKTWNDLQAQIGDLADLATDEKDNLVAAINEAAQSGGGGTDSEVPTPSPSDVGKVLGVVQTGEFQAGYDFVHLITLPDVIYLDITGATVGQTIKVHSVDSDGRPTSWEAVDMPSGGGGSGETWEAINAITLSDAVNTVTINTDSGGNAIALKKVRILVEGSATSKQDLFLNGSRYIREQVVGTAASVGAFSAEPFCGKMYCFAVKNITSNYAANNQNANVFSGETTITEIKLIVNNDGTFSAGTKFTIQGVRA